MGAFPWRLLAAREDRIEALVPYELSPNTQHQVIVQAGFAHAISDPISVAEAQPIVLTTAAGMSQGRIYVFGEDGARILADESAPAAEGDTLILECAGLGTLVDSLITGQTPPSPAPLTAHPVTVTIGGKEAPLVSSGLSPTSPGVYEVRAIRPRSLRGRVFQWSSKPPANSARR